MLKYVLSISRQHTPWQVRQWAGGKIVKISIWLIRSRESLAKLNKSGNPGREERCEKYNRKRKTRKNKHGGVGRWGDGQIEPRDYSV